MYENYKRSKGQREENMTVATAVFDIKERERDKITQHNRYVLLTH